MGLIGFRGKNALVAIRAEMEFAMMTRRTFQTGLLLAASGSLAFSAAAQGARGSWSGVLDVGSKRLRLKLEIESDGAARIFSLDQGGQPIAGRSTSGSADQIEI